MGHYQQGFDGSAQKTVVASGAFRRSQGPLTPQEVANAREAGLSLSFDPVQNGWLRADTQDDFDHARVRPGWPSVSQALSRTAAVGFRPWVPSDAPRFRALLDNPDVWAFLPAAYPGPISQEMASDLIELSQDGALHTVRAILLQDQPVGQVRLEYADSEPELSYWLGQDHWGQGIGARAVARFVEQCFADDPELDHMIARVKPENLGSLRILEKAGFQREGRSNAAPDWIILRRDRMGSEA
ncbi:GNAT family N-acetyltransferase [Aestuariivita sp.]|jgi:RimJ/RimL family protein N-acetyltransferase|uniref:GNAT family N-acetyltransferase n=1 Tax=Aestuariivita sp. TaxID=1872407 RepID=UPI002170F9A9|nr:GNAT family N-acetyltransferase [Aestuariivita sp.]MCE8005545.1 GNAT family N-acetyltransferase [Aestuariivita sp.]